MITGFYAGILAFMYFVLIFNVIRYRIQFKIGIGNGGNHTLDKAIRVHGNFAEHVPFAVLLIGLCDYNGTDPAILHALGIILVASRIMHAYGLLKTSVRSSGRTAGVIGTVSVMLAAATLLIVQFLLT